MGQHYVPRKYLRGFCEPGTNGILLQYDKVLDKFARVSVATAANERGFYSDEVEKLLAEQVENPANQAIEKLRRRDPISSAERAQLALYMATMLKRVPRHRERSRRMIPDALDQTVGELKTFLVDAAAKGLITADVLAGRLAETDAVAARFRLDPPREVLDQIEIPWPTKDMVELIYFMTWRPFLSSGPSYFITSDNPFYFFEHCGIGSDEAEFVFPLATNLALHGCWQEPTPGEPALRKLRQNVVREFNRRIASACNRFVYYFEKQDWIRQISRKQEPFLSLIRW